MYWKPEAVMRLSLLGRLLGGRRWEVGLRRERERMVEEGGRRRCVCKGKGVVEQGRRVERGVGVLMWYLRMGRRKVRREQRGGLKRGESSRRVK